tara:strand:+ start:242 stop:565 length:324 start_codon:yes stop_codon:yes gene_type:complete
MADILNLNEDNFEKTVNDSKLPLIIDFWAEWCAPCKAIAPILDELAVELNEKLLIGKVNLDENQDLAMKYSIRSIPTILFFKDGELKDTKVGLSSKTDLISWVSQNS